MIVGMESLDINIIRYRGGAHMLRSMICWTNLLATHSELHWDSTFFARINTRKKSSLSSMFKWKLVRILENAHLFYLFSLLILCFGFSGGQPPLHSWAANALAVFKDACSGGEWPLFTIVAVVVVTWFTGTICCDPR